MADEIIKTPDEVAKHNDATARTLANQGNDTLRPATDADFKSAHEGLDALAEAVTKKNLEEKVEEPVVVEKKETTPEPVVEKKEIAVVEKTTDTDPDRFFKDAPSLPSNASPKSTEAFQGIKVRAAQEISARETEIESLKKEIAARDEKLKNPIPAEVEAELKSHREWRAKLDVDADPKFAEFDKKVSDTRDFVYDQLRKSPHVAADSLIEKIKSLGGPEMVDWTKIYESLKDPTMQRIIESSIADIEKSKFIKAQAVASTKKNIEQYLADKSKETTNNVSATKEATKAKLGEITKDMAFLKPMTVDAKATEQSKKEVEAYNKWVTDTNESIEVALNDNSPEMRAIEIAGIAQLLHLQRVHESTRTVLAATQKELKEAKASLAKYKGVSVNRIRESNAPTNSSLPKAKSNEQQIFNTRANEAIDDLAKEIMAKRAAANQ